MAEVGTEDKSVAWFQTELEDVNPQARSILETYCKLPSNEVVPHVLKIVSHALLPHKLLIRVMASLSHDCLHIFLRHAISC